MTRINVWVPRRARSLGRCLALSVLLWALLAGSGAAHAQGAQSSLTATYIDPQGNVTAKTTQGTNTQVSITVPPGPDVSVSLKLEGTAAFPDLVANWDVVDGEYLGGAGRPPNTEWGTLTERAKLTTEYNVPSAEGTYRVVAHPSGEGGGGTWVVVIEVRRPGRRWLPGPAITDVVMTPPNGATLTGGQTRTLSVSGATDQDEYVDNGQAPKLTTATSEPRNQLLLYTWSCDRPDLGDFVDANNNVIPPPSSTDVLSVKWRAKPGVVGVATVRCTIDDDTSPTDDDTNSLVEAPDTGTRNDARSEKNFVLDIKQVVPVVATYTGKTRACAGSIVGDALHEVRLSLTITDERTNAPLANTYCLLSLSNNPGSEINDEDGPLLRRAMFIDGASTVYDDTSLTDQYYAPTDGSGKLEVAILSSRILGTPAIEGNCDGNPLSFKAQGSTTKSPSLPLQFDQAEGKRRFGVIEFDRGFAADDGFEFEKPVFTAAGQVIKVTYHLKYRPVLGKEPEKAYFRRKDNGQAALSIDTNGDGIYSPAEKLNYEVVRPLSDDADWKPVASHRIRFKITRRERIGILLHLANINYAFFSDSNGQPVDENGAQLPVGSTTVPFTTDGKTSGDGTFVFYICTGQLFTQDETFFLYAQERTQRQ